MRLKIRASTLWNNGRWKVQRRGNFNPPRHFASVDVDKRVTRAKAKLETPPPSLFHPRSIVDNFFLIPLSALVSFLLFKGCYNGGCNTMEERFVEEWKWSGCVFWIDEEEVIMIKEESFRDWKRWFKFLKQLLERIFLNNYNSVRSHLNC